MSKLHVYNTLSKKKEEFRPMRAPFVGMYVCGPTVYGDAHLGHARPAITFDILFRYLKFLDYKVRYVRNITDVGHLENDADEGEDKIGKKARLEQVEPMEIVQYYTDRYHDNMKDLNVSRPSIEPHASGHIIEQIALIEEIIKNGFAYAVNGSVYFDVVKYNNTNDYGKLSGRVLEDLIGNTRELTSQDEKRNSADFALWKKADSKHIMRWPSPWSDGFPGWHLECSVMSSKYLGERFDIHGGGLDLLFPHHECEIAQSRAAHQKDPANYWMHNNMITINGQKMGKSLGNFITLNDLFAGNHELLEQGYSPMTIRFFILQAHYRSTVDFSNDALKAAEKGLDRMSKAYSLLSKLPIGDKSDINVSKIATACEDAINDDFSTHLVIATLFDAVKSINSIAAGKETITAFDLEALKTVFDNFAIQILGLDLTTTEANNSEVLDNAMEVLLNLRATAKANKDFATADAIRDQLTEKGITIKDSKDGATWSYDA